MGQQGVNDFSDTFLQRLPFGIHRNLRFLRWFIGGVDAGEQLDFAQTGSGIQAFRDRAARTLLGGN